MAGSVWKYGFKIDDDIEVHMPKGAEFLAVQMQGDQPMMWVRVSGNADTEARRFKLRGTGHKVGDDCGKHLGTFQMHGGMLVFHLFEAA